MEMSEALIRQRVEDWTKAICAKDVDGVISLYVPDVLSFDIVPPLRYVGAENKRRAWQEAFAAYSGPINYDGQRLERHSAGPASLRQRPRPRDRHAPPRSQPYPA